MCAYAINECAHDGGGDCAAVTTRNRWLVMRKRRRLSMARKVTKPVFQQMSCGLGDSCLVSPVFARMFRKS